MLGEFCRTCSEKWGKQLWKRSCACNGAVNLVFTCPGTLAFSPEPVPDGPAKPKITKAKKAKEYLK